MVRSGISVPGSCKEKIKAIYDCKYFESALRYNRSLAFVHILACVLPDDSDLLDKRICSDCGAVDSVRSFSTWIPRKDDYDKGFKCKECGHCISTYGNWELTGKEDFSMALREFRDEAYTEIAKRKKHGW